MRINTDAQKINEILTRGVEEIIDRQHLEAALKSGRKLRVKLGIDPTGPKIHIGRAIILWKLRAFQDLGHQIVLIIGDFTSQIGDASDKETMRKCLTEKEVRINMKDYEKQIGKILDLKKTEVRRNSEWLGQFSFKKFLGLAQNFTAQQMIQRRNFKERWDSENPIGLHELSYPLMQGYDSAAIKADVELGGFDQLFNLMIGRDIQKIFNQKPQDIMVMTMLNGLDGRKMSTSWGNVITIVNEPNDMFGKIMSMRDELIGNYFELCTQLPLEEIAKIKQETANPRDLKARLAKEIVALYHGEKTAQKAEEEFNKIFRDKELPDEIIEITKMPEEIRLDKMLYVSGAASSMTAARRLIEQGGVEIDQEKILDWKKEIETRDGMIVRAGKRRWFKIKK